MHEARIIGLFITPVAGTPLRPVRSVHAVPGQGLQGDRNFRPTPWEPTATIKELGKQITLIESESLEALQREVQITLDPAESRRNLITQGVALNHLVGREFNVGEVRLRGVRLCEPCGHLESLTQEGVMKALIHRGGLRAQILTEGDIRMGDPVLVGQSQQAAACAS